MRVASDLVVIGAPGAGKSTVGRALAQRLGLPFVDVDERIEAGQGKPVREIFADSGEARFRELERSASIAALSEPGVVALGSGAVAHPGVADALRRATVVWLQASVAVAGRRLGLNQAPPGLRVNLRGTLIKFLAERTPVYESVATVTVDTDKASVTEVVERIIATLQERELKLKEADR
ncbi:MAG: shikimate kinase [Micropruina sp.]